jgi:ribosomal-protein-alanine N-acetyltransferase
MIVIWLILGEAHIATLAVHPDFRGRGTGSQLLEVALQEARNKGAREAMLEVRASNHVAQALYDGYGFEVVYRRSRYYRDNNEDALLMNLENLDDLILKREEV